MDPAADSSGDPDLAAVTIDRPSQPTLHYHWDGSRLPAEGVVQVLLSATSADGQRSRGFMVVLRDGAPESQYVRDPATGPIVWLRPVSRTDTSGSDSDFMGVVDLDPTGGVSATFPAALLAPLGAGWAWTASVTVDGALVDACDRASR